MRTEIVQQHDKAEHFNQFTFRTALLSISLLTIMAGAGVAPGISKIAQAFPDIGETMIKMVLSIPPLFMVLASIITGKLCHWIKQRSLLITGLLLFLFGGVGAGYTYSFSNLLLFRALLGIGTGMILPFSTGIIGECYAGDQKTKMLGYAFAANNLGAIIATLVAGILATISWNFMFNIYWIGLPVILLVLFFLTDLSKDQSIRKLKPALPIKVYSLGFCGFLTMIIFFAIPSNLSLLISEKQIGTVKLVGIVLTINAVSMFMAGLFLLKNKKALKKNFLPLVFLFLAWGFWGIAYSSTALTLILSIILSGLGIGSLFPYILNRLSDSVEKEQNVMAMSIGMASAWMGQFLSPIILDGISNSFGGNTADIFRGIAIMMLLGFVFTCVNTAVRNWAYRRNNTQ